MEERLDLGQAVSGVRKSRSDSSDNVREMLMTLFNYFGTSPFSSKKVTDLSKLEEPKPLKNKLVELEGKYVGKMLDSNILYLSVDEKNVPVEICPETVGSTSITGRNLRVGDSIYIIAMKVSMHKEPVAIVIIRESEKAIFESIESIYGRANAIKSFYSHLSADEKQCVLERLEADRYEKTSAVSLTRFSASHTQKLFYELAKDTFLPGAQKEIEAMLSESSASKRKSEQRLRYVLNILPECKARKDISIEEFREELDKRFYKMERAKQQCVDLIATMKRADKRGFSILLVGSPGVGKTSIMTAIAECLGLPYGMIPLNAMSTTIDLAGLDNSYDASDVGSIISEFYKAGTSEMVLGLDELDKIVRTTKEGDPYSVLLPLMTGEHTDKFLECPVSTENTVLVFTANSVDNIPETIMNRFNAVIYMDDYDYEDKMIIAKKHLIPKIIENYHLDPAKITFTDQALSLIITRYCQDAGARDLKHNIERVFSRMLSKGYENEQHVITEEEVFEVLDDMVEETPELIFQRNRPYYSEPVAKELKKCLAAMKVSSGAGGDRFGVEKKREKVDYLLACRTEESTYLDVFDPKEMADFLHKELYGMDNVIDEAVNFYYTSFLQGENLNSNLALCGGYGIGKSSIVEGLAKAIGYHYVKVSLNGIEDVKSLRGFPISYAGSAPGCIVKGIKDAGSLKVVMQLDEIDKLKQETAVALLDLLDRDFTDAFLEVPINLSQVIFIATANDWGRVPAVIRDRFIVIDVNGYSREDKKHIVSDYIIPKLERGYSKSGVSISIDEDAEEYLLKTHASSFGVRDAQKAIQRICSKKLVDQVGKKNAMRVKITKSDVKKYLGEEPIPRGNFPEEEGIPGISKALAVSGANMGSCFAIETVLLEDEKEGVEITGLPKETAVDSVKIAITCIKKKYPDLLKNKHIHVHFGEGSVPKDGPSAGVALLMSILSAALDKPVMNKKGYDVAFTGELSLTGGVFAIGGVLEKCQAADDSGCTKVFIPMQNYEHLSKGEKATLERFSCEIIPVSHINQVIEEIFNKTKMAERVGEVTVFNKVS